MAANYYSGAYVSRPGVLTAVGVFSILIASISLLVDFGGFFFAKFTTMVATRTAPVAVVAAPPPAPAPQSAQTEYIAPDGFSADQRKIVIDGLNQVRPISDVRQRQLDGLLADVGRQVIQISPENLTTDRVAAYVTETHDIPSGSGGPPDDMFTLGSGRLQLTDASAVFFPENSPSPIRSGGGSYTDASGQTHLASTQIAAVIDRVKALLSQPMTDPQVAALEAQLESSAQALITPSDSVAEAAAQVKSVQTFPDGTVGITTASSSISIATTGQTFPGLIALGGMQNGWGPGPTIARRDAVLLMLDAILSFLAAGFLLACGIMVLRNIPASRWMHLVWAGAKLILVVLSCYAMFSVVEQLDASSPDAQSAAMAWMLIMAAPGAIYPVVVLVVMNLRMVKEFLGTATVGRIF